MTLSRNLTHRVVWSRSARPRGRIAHRDPGRRGDSGDGHPRRVRDRQIHHGYVGLVYSRMEIGVPIFFVLSGFLLFGPGSGPWRPTVPSPSVRHMRGIGCGGSCRPTWSPCWWPTSLPLPHGRTQSRPHLEGFVPQPDADPNLHRPLPVRPAPRPHPNVEPCDRSRVLRGITDDGLSTAGGAVPSAVAARPADHRTGRPGVHHGGVADPRSQHRLAARMRPAVASHLFGLVRRRHDAGRPASPGDRASRWRACRWRWCATSSCPRRLQASPPPRPTICGRRSRRPASTP